MGLFKKFIAQTRKPEGFLGKLMVGSMNSGHSKLADWGMKHLTEIDAGTIVELGCGGGRNASELLKLYPKSSLTAIDYSEVSVQKAKDTNSDLIREGRCVVLQDNVASLPLENDFYDLATAFETVYFWPGLTTCFSEVCRILKPGGTFMICNESDGSDETALRFEKIIDGMKCYTSEQLESALKAAGFSEIKTDNHPSKPWITVLAKI